MFTCTWKYPISWKFMQSTFRDEKHSWTDRKTQHSHYTFRLHTLCKEHKKIKRKLGNGTRHKFKL
jgi:hypothetical protein